MTPAGAGHSPRPRGRTDSGDRSMRHEKQVETSPNSAPDRREEKHRRGRADARATDSFTTRISPPRMERDVPRPSTIIGLSGDLPEPGSYFTVDDFGVPVLMIRSRDGRFRAFLNACAIAACAWRARPAARRTHSPVRSTAGPTPIRAIWCDPAGRSVRPDGQGLQQSRPLPAEEWHGMLWIHPQPRVARLPGLSATSPTSSPDRLEHARLFR